MDRVDDFSEADKSDYGYNNSLRQLLMITNIIIHMFYYFCKTTDLSFLQVMEDFAKSY